MSIIILSYNQGSQSARSLRDHLASGPNSIRTFIARREGSTHRPSPRNTYINWGCTNNNWVLNKPEAMRVSTNKRNFFNFVNGTTMADSVPPWAVSRDEARHLFTGARTKVVCRGTLSGHSGQGIVIANSPDELPDCELYTKYIPKQSEWRFHFFKNTVTDIQRKVLRSDIPNENINWSVRTHQNGFVYQREGLDVPQNVSSIANRFAQHTPLDFGALDIIFNGASGRAYMLEVNTSPGLTGTTLTNYAAQFRTEHAANVRRYQASRR